MKIVNHAGISAAEITELENALAGRENLLQILAWNNRVVDSVAQDEFTHDLVVAWRDVFLVFDAT